MLRHPPLVACPGARARAPVLLCSRAPVLLCFRSSCAQFRCGGVSRPRRAARAHDAPGAHLNCVDDEASVRDAARRSSRTGARPPRHSTLSTVPCAIQVRRRLAAPTRRTRPRHAARAPELRTPIDTARNGRRRATTASPGRADAAAGHRGRHSRHSRPNAIPATPRTRPVRDPPGRGVRAGRAWAPAGAWAAGTTARSTGTGGRAAVARRPLTRDRAMTGSPGHAKGPRPKPGPFLGDAYC